MQYTIHRSASWIALIIGAFICTFTAYHYFPQAFPILNVSITMDRHGALAHAQQLVTQHNFSPLDGIYAASFDTDYEAKTFIELEAGGKDAFVAMMQDGLYEPYTWHVRHFKEYDPNETRIFFTPAGIPYGFKEFVEENAPGAALTPDEARIIAEKNAAQDWRISFADYTLIDSSKETRPNGRIDHVFIYERPIRIGEGYYRLRLEVTGDALTQVRHFIHVPEAFKRRYEHMRSLNHTLATFASAIMFGLFFMVGCLLGLLLLSRKRFVIWRAPLLWAAFISCLGALVALNKLPLMWMHYNTATSVSGFLASTFMGIIWGILYNLIFYGLVFAAGESLTRRAFGNQIQLWRSWFVHGVANSYPIVKETVLAYLFVAFKWAYLVIFYLVTMRYFSWWIPSSAHFDPNSIATYFPWFDSIASALKAGFWEECMFRAVPLAGAALLGAHFGKRAWWIGGALIVQALVFGAAHANYAMQPAYARVVELFFPSLIYGTLYLFYGLLPAIIAHFFYDVVAMSLPLFAAATSGAWINQSLVIIFGLVPLWIVLYARIKNGAWTAIASQFLNRAWHPPALSSGNAYAAHEQKIYRISSRTHWLALGIGACAVLVWFGTTQFSPDVPRLELTRQQAIEQAQQHLCDCAIELDSRWSPLGKLSNTLDPLIQHRFVWQEGGKDAYASLLNTHLFGPHWTARFVQFEGDLVQRAEAHHISLAHKDRTIRAHHILPESMEGTDLSESDARTAVHTFLHDQFGYDAPHLKEVSATSDKKPARRDWRFVFADEHNYPLEKGQARILVTLSGDKVTNYKRFIHVPQEWERAELNREQFAHIIISLCSLLLYLIFLFGLGYSASQWAITAPRTKTLLMFFAGFTTLYIARILNGIPSMIACFNTTQPFYEQLFQFFGTSWLWAIIQGGMMAILVVTVNAYRPAFKLSKNMFNAFVGSAIGALFAATESVLTYFLPLGQPLLSECAFISTYNPFFAYVRYVGMQWLSATVLILIFCAILNSLTDYWKRKHIVASLLCFIFTIVLTSSLINPYNFTLFMSTGIAFGVLLLASYICALRFGYSLIPLATGSYFILNIMQDAALAQYPGAACYALSTAVIIAGLSTLWFSRLND